jgi:hypothetical protein
MAERAAAGPPRGAAPPPAPNFEARLGALEESIDHFRVEAERYFNGGQALPPEELRQNIQRQLRELHGATLRAAAEQFRLASLEARFNSLSELFGRRLREREEGRSTTPTRAVTARAPRHDARAGIVFRDQLDASAVEALWIGLASGPDGPKLELESFRGYFARQVTEIRVKTGAAAVQFRVVEEEGKLKLKAKPVAASEK